MTATSTYTTSLPKEERDELIAAIIKRVVPQAVFLLGKATTHRQTESLFGGSSTTAVYTSHLYLLLLVEGDDDLSLNGLQDKAENSLQHRIPSTVIVLRTATFCNWLLQGHPFAVRILHGAEVLYQCGTVRLPVPATVQEPCPKERRRLFDQARIKVDGFLASADLHGLRKEHRLAAFMLHQAAEQSLSTMLVLQTGYRAATHNIDKLLRYCSMVYPQLLDLFPKHSEGATKLFGLLKRAYIDSRYKDDYVISGEELAGLTGKVRHIRELFAQLRPIIEWEEAPGC